MASRIRVSNLQGENGGIYITNTSLNTFSRPVSAIYAHSATVIATAVSYNVTGTLTTVAIPAGSVWYGSFSAVTLTSGKVTCYYQNDR